jgi:ppGpp synthetase/RelA/SpoT-type nucleotidyltranferase
VQRLCELYDQVITTLVLKYNDLAKQLQQNSIRDCILFLKDFLPKFNSINLQLQKSNLTIIDTALIIDKLNNNVTDIISHVKEENDLSIFLR